VYNLLQKGKREKRTGKEISLITLHVSVHQAAHILCPPQSTAPTPTLPAKTAEAKVLSALFPPQTVPPLLPHSPVYHPTAPYLPTPAQAIPATASHNPSVSAWPTSPHGTLYWDIQMARTVPPNSGLGQFAPNSIGDMR
jgi:hypothetical protein